MIGVFYYADKEREINLLNAISEGAAKSGDSIIGIPIDNYAGVFPGADFAIVIGVKGISRPCLDDYTKAGKGIIFIDKGYTRRPGRETHERYFRISVGAFHPTDWFQDKPRPADRWASTGIPVYPRRNDGDFILFAGSSQKYCNWYSLGDATEYAARVVQDIRAATGMPVVYRPKPSWAAAVPVPGAGFSTPADTINTALVGARAMVTHGSNAAVDALCFGTPVVLLGPDAISRPVAGRSLENLLWPTDKVRLQWLHNLAYCQWTPTELANGSAWKHISKELWSRCHVGP